MSGWKPGQGDAVLLGLEIEEGGCELRTVLMEKVRKWTHPIASREECSPADSLILVQ